MSVTQIFRERFAWQLGQRRDMDWSRRSDM